jgi:DNA adenine methylase
MRTFLLPKKIDKVIVPPIKCQGIKTKLVKFIAENIYWEGKGKWVEPFLGSGVVLFNIQPKKALVGDINPHIINFYVGIQNREITHKKVKLYLEKEGEKLSKIGESYYYEVRDRFNKEKNPLDFLFLNRASFNGVIRFNSKGEFNAPFCKKPNRFSKSYITKIINQVKKIEEIMQGKDWEFVNEDWKKVVSECSDEDFIYLDPPYIGRHTDYYNKWTEKDADEMVKIIKNLNSGFALSMWKQNKYRKNEYIKKWEECVILEFTHFYHVGSKEDYRNEMIEALIINPKNYAKDILFNNQVTLDTYMKNY